MKERGLAAASLLYWAAALSLGAGPETPLNDEWAYAPAAQALAATGTLPVPQASVAAFLGQALWGALFSRLFGPGYAPLRWSVMVLAWLGGCAFYRLLRRSGASEEPAAAGTVLLLMNPIFFPLSKTFMTDAPGLALTLIGASLAWPLGGKDGAARLWLSSIAAGWAGQVRQTALSLPAMLGLWSIRAQGKFRVVDGFAVWTAPALAVLAGGIFFPERAFSRLYLTDAVARLADPGAWTAAFLRAQASLVYCGLFALPLAAAVWTDGPLGRLKKISSCRLAAAGILGGTLLVFVLTAGRLPYPNGIAEAAGLPDFFNHCSYLGSRGLACLNVEGADLRALPLLGAPWFWTLLGILACASFTTLAALGPATKAAVFLGAVTGLEVLALTGGPAFMDRYILPLSAFALAWGLHPPSTPHGHAVLWAGVLLTAGASWAGNADYLRQVAAVKELGEAAAAQGIPRNRIRAGTEWCWAETGAWLSAPVPGRRIGSWPEAIPNDCLLKPLAAVSYLPPAALGPRGRTLLSEKRFPSAFGGENRLYLYRQNPP